MLLIDIQTAYDLNRLAESKQLINPIKCNYIFKLNNVNRLNGYYGTGILLRFKNMKVPLEVAYMDVKKPIWVVSKKCWPHLRVHHLHRLHEKPSMK